MKNVLLWLPRILTILAILFMLMFSLDVFTENAPAGKTILGFLAHNIPAFVLALILFISWKNELIGGLLLIAAFIAAAIFFRSFNGNPGSLIVIVPFLVSGLFFVLYHFLYKKEN